MVQLNILSGNKAGTSWRVRRFPVRIGRSSTVELQLEEPGLWDQHLELNFVPREGFVMIPHPNALVTIDEQPVKRAILRSGDILNLGALKLQFWLAPTRQSGMRFREALTWAAMAAMSLVQVGLVYWLLSS